MFRWFSRCLPGLSLICFSFLLIFAFTDVNEWLPWLSCSFIERRAYHRYEPGNAPRSAPVRLKLSQQIYIYYTIFVHVDTVLFSSRLCLALLRVRSELKKTLMRRNDLPTPSAPSRIPDRSATSTPVSQYDSDYSDETISTLVEPVSSDEVVHAIILPNYAEDMETLTATLSVLASHDRAATQYEVSEQISIQGERHNC